MAGWTHDSSPSKRGSSQNWAWSRARPSISCPASSSPCGSRRVANVHPDACRSSSTMTYSVGSSPEAA